MLRISVLLSLAQIFLLSFTLKLYDLFSWSSPRDFRLSLLQMEYTALSWNPTFLPGLLSRDPSRHSNPSPPHSPGSHSSCPAVPNHPVLPHHHPFQRRHLHNCPNWSPCCQPCPLPLYHPAGVIFKQQKSDRANPPTWNKPITSLPRKKIIPTP